MNAMFRRWILVNPDDPHSPFFEPIWAFTAENAQRSASKRVRDLGWARGALHSPDPEWVGG